MKRGNVIRLIVWGTIAAIFLVCGITGLILFQSGHGEVGAVISETKPLVNTFNKLESLEQFTKVGTKIYAKTKMDTIVVSYESDISSASFTLNYDDTSGARLLTMKYNVVDEIIANVMVRYLLEAIAVTKGYPEGKVFEKFELSDFTKTTPLQGANITTEESTTTVILNMDTSVLDSNIDFTEEIKYLTLEQAQTIVDGLTPGNSISNKTDNLAVHINMYDTYYSIFIRDNKEIYSLDIYESIKSIISAISGDAIKDEFVTICPEFNNTNYENEESNIKIIYDSTGANAYTEFDNTNKVLQVDVKLINQSEQGQQ